MTRLRKPAGTKCSGRGPTDYADRLPNKPLQLTAAIGRPLRGSLRRLQLSVMSVGLRGEPEHLWW